MTTRRSRGTAGWARWLALLAVLSLLAAACGDEEAQDAPEVATAEAEDEGPSFDEQAAEQQQGSRATVEEEEDAACQAERGGELVISGPSDIGNLDPLTSSSFNTQYRLGPAMGRLFTFDTGPDVGYTQQVLEPQLATGYEISDDGLTYTFNLREGVKWHDIAPVNGREFTSADVKATFEAVRAEGHQAALLENVESIETPDDHTVVLNLSAPFAPLLENMASHFLWILPQEAFQEGYDRTTTVIGTGPFQLEEREVDVSTRYVRNPDYWEEGVDGEPLPYLDELELVVISDTQQALAAFQAGEVGVLTNSLPTALREQLKADMPEGFHGQWIDAGMGQVGVNMAREPFNDLRVRQAISMAIDREGMGQTIRGGGTIPSNVAPALQDWVLPEEERYELLPYDPERAKALLAEAGYPDGLDATLIATEGYGALYTQQTEWLVEDLRAIGINVNLEMIDYSTYFGSRWPDAEYDLQFGPQTPFLGADEWLRLQMHSEGGRNWYNISDPTLDQMLEEQVSILDVEERQEKVKEIQRYALENVLNPIPVWTYFTEWSYAPEVTDFYRHASYGYPGIEDVWLDPTGECQRDA